MQEPFSVLFPNPHSPWEWFISFAWMIDQELCILRDSRTLHRYYFCPLISSNVLQKIKIIFIIGSYIYLYLYKANDIYHFDIHTYIYIRANDIYVHIDVCMYVYIKLYSMLIIFMKLFYIFWNQVKVICWLANNVTNMWLQLEFAFQNITFLCQLSKMLRNIACSPNCLESFARHIHHL